MTSRYSTRLQKTKRPLPGRGRFSRASRVMHLLHDQHVSQGRTIFGPPHTEKKPKIENASRLIRLPLPRRPLIRDNSAVPSFVPTRPHFRHRYWVVAAVD